MRRIKAILISGEPRAVPRLARAGHSLSHRRLPRMSSRAKLRLDPQGRREGAAIRAFAADLPCFVVMVCILAKDPVIATSSEYHDHPPQRLLLNLLDATLQRPVSSAYPAPLGCIRG